MKVSRNDADHLRLQKSNNRWKWMVGATAAGVTASQASAITISLVNNYISATGGNHLNADLTGDGHPDLTIANPFYSVWPNYSSPNSFLNRHYASVNLNGVPAYVYWRSDWGGIAHERLGSRWANFFGTSSAGGTLSLTGSIPLFFKDLHINGGAPTNGLLQVTVSGPGDANGRAEVRLDSFTYTSNTAVQGASLAVADQGVSHTVPDQGSTLALLAMGAGGVLALRRWRAAQGRS
jgi:hypothetical protein